MPNGVRSGVTVCVGRALGAGLPSLASLAIRNGLLLLGCWLPLPLFAVCAFNSGWARIFTRDEAVILQLHALVPWLVVNSCAGGLMAIANAVMAGCARPKSPFLHPGPTRTKVAPSDTLPHRQKTAAKLAQLCFTCIGFPLGLLLGFSFGLGVQGFVAGQAAGLAGLAQGRGGVVRPARANNDSLPLPLRRTGIIHRCGHVQRCPDRLVHSVHSCIRACDSANAMSERSLSTN